MKTSETVGGPTGILQVSWAQLMRNTKGRSMRKIDWFIPLAVTVFLASLVATGACRSSAPPPEAAATVKDLMLSKVDPAADIVWLSVTTVQSAEGTIDTAPKTDEEWEKVRKGAMALVEGADLLKTPGIHVAPPGHKSETPGVELEPLEMEALINKDPAAWGMRADALRAAGLAAVQAAEAKDAPKVFEVGEQIERACENCHTHYWYPNEKIPAVPTELTQSGQ